MCDREHEVADAEHAGDTDSITFARCAGCRHAAEVDRAAGTLLCKRHQMLVNAEADEIPDDCVEYGAAEGTGEGTAAGE